MAAGFFALAFLVDALRVEDDRDPALAEDFAVDRFGGLCFVATGVRVSDVAPSPLATHEVTQIIHTWWGFVAVVARLPLPGLNAALTSEDPRGKDPQ